MTHSFDSIKLSVSQFEFLNLQNNDNYINNILNIATNELISAIDQQESLLELEFPIDRKSDISSSETLDGTKSFTLQLLSKLLSRRNYSKNDICFVLPEKQEIFRISKEVDIDKLSFAVAALDYFPQGISPSLVFIINPGFNIEEWIQIPKIVQNLPTIKSVVLVNGNINRLLSGISFHFYFTQSYPNYFRILPLDILSRSSKSYKRLFHQIEIYFEFAAFID